MSADTEYQNEEAVKALQLHQEPDLGLGSPPLIMGESLEEYRSLSGRFRREIQPVGMIELLLVKDVVDFTWELKRLQNMKAEAVNNKRRQAMAHIVMEVLNDRDYASPEVRGQSYRWARRWVDNDPVACPELMKRLAQSGFSIQSVAAEALNIAVRQVQAIDDMLAKLLKRRDAALRNIQKHRKELAAMLRRKSDAEVRVAESEKEAGSAHQRTALQ